MKLGGDKKQPEKKQQAWSACVTIVLVKAKDLLAMDDNGTSDPYFKFRLGNERYKSKVSLDLEFPFFCHICAILWLICD